MTVNAYDDSAPPALDLGTLRIHGPVVGRDYEMTCVGESTFGEATPIEEAIQSLLANGSLSRTIGHQNREPSFTVKITAPNVHGLEAGEADLFAQLWIRNRLTWTPPHGLAHPAIFEVVTSSAQYLFDDQAERQLRRYFSLRLVCRPFAMSQNLVTGVLPVPSSSATETSLDTCAALTGWSQPSPTPPAGYPQVVSGKIAFKAPSEDHQLWWPAVTIKALRAFSPAVNSGAYLMIRATGGFRALRAYLDDVALTLVAAQGSDYYFASGDSSVSALRIEADFDGRYGSPQIMMVDQVSAWDALPRIGTGRQSVRSVIVEGSAPTEGSLAVEHASSGLGTVMVYTYPSSGDGYRPDLSAYRAGALPPADASNVSGYAADLDTAITFEPPSAAMAPARFALVARLKAASTGIYPVKWTAQTVVGGSSVGPQLQGVVNVNFAGTSYQTELLALVQLPPTKVPPEAGAVVRITIVNNDPPGSPTITLDEAWAYDLTNGDLTIAKNVARRLWIESPTLENEGLGAIWTGIAADKSDAYALQLGADIMSIGDHEWLPGEVNVHVVTSTAVDPTTTLRYVPRAAIHPRS